MPSAEPPQWHEKAGDFLSSSGVKLKESGKSAGTYVEEAAKDYKENVVEVKVGSIVKCRLEIFQQPSTKLAMQEKLLSAAASTGTFFRKSFSETKDKVAIGKIKVEEVAKMNAQRSKTLLTDIERWQKELLALMVACCDYPHSRHLCLNFLFNASPHESYCKQCFCYVCDTPAPCKLWTKVQSGH